MKKKTIILFTSISIFLFSSFPVFAAPTPAASNTGIGCGEGFGFIAQILCPINKGDTAVVGGQLNNMISVIIGVMTTVAAIWFIFQFIQGGYGWITSGGDKNTLQQARDRIINAVIGLIIVVSAYIVIGVIGKIVGLNDIFNPGKILMDLGK